MLTKLPFNNILPIQNSHHFCSLTIKIWCVPNFCESFLVWLNLSLPKGLFGFVKMIIIVAGMCPVLCSGHGDYEDGQCRCFPGWKGLECQLRHDQCEVADCSGHGQCINGKCVCARGYTGHACQQSKQTINLHLTLETFISTTAVELFTKNEK